ncbi:hypothetical protein FA15DRAFT_558263, partial [Coprinopsis marcescibilis]
QPHDQPEEEEQERVSHYFGPKQYYCVETICYPCGAVKAWALFAKSESPNKILKFLQEVFPTPESCPSFICIHRACLVLRTVMCNPIWRPWLDTSCFVVDTYHYNNHKASDKLCQKWCNPAPEDGSQPNLVIIDFDAQGLPYFKRAFNTQVCEQLNAWLGGFSAILKQMTISNFKWLIHVMLYY